MRSFRQAMPAMILAALAMGCQTNKPAPPEYKTVATDPMRATEQAKLHNEQAAGMIDRGDLAGAEKELKAALAEDAYFGPAHSNLGAVYLRQNQFYTAALEFQYAAKLMPKRSEPLNNLGMLYEKVGKYADAAKAYEDALRLEPENVDIEGNLARLYVRQGRNDERVRQLLGDIALRDTRPGWTAWAHQRLAIWNHPGEATTRPTSMPGAEIGIPSPLRK